VDADSLTVPRLIWVLISAALLVSIAAGLTYLARQLPYTVRLERVDEPKTADRIVDTSERVRVEPTTVPFAGVPVPHVVVTTTEIARPPAPAKKSKTRPSARQILQSRWGR